MDTAGVFSRGEYMTSKLLLISTIMIVVPVFAQIPSGPRPSFEVASIKLHVNAGPGPSVGGIQNILGSPRMDMIGVTFKMLMENAYAVRDFQVIGGPDWTAS